MTISSCEELQARSKRRPFPAAIGRLAARIGLAFVPCALALIPAPGGRAQAVAAPDNVHSMRIMPGITRAVSRHVHVISSEGRRGVPNVGIIVGSRAAMIVDSGLGKASGETILAEARKVAGNRPLYVIATHFHPEHIGGEQAFDAATILRPRTQQQEVDEQGAKMIATFRAMSAENTSLLEGFEYRPATILFDGSMTLDLGGVVVDLIKGKPSHTDGDVAIFVRGDNVLFTGDLVQQNYAPILMGAHSSIASWLAGLDELEKLPAEVIVPAHTAVTDRRAFSDMRDILTFLRDQGPHLRASGAGNRAAQDRLIADFKRRFPACTNADWLRLSIPKL